VRFEIECEAFYPFFRGASIEIVGNAGHVLASMVLRADWGGIVVFYPGEDLLSKERNKDV
jgi:hypothetical protein